MAGDMAVFHRKVPVVEQLRDNVKDERVEESIQNPSPKAVLLEEDASLAQLVQLWIAVEQSGGDELVKDSHREWRQNSEEHVIEGERPRFVDNLS